MPKQNERVVNRKYSIEYFDDLNRNTFYYNTGYKTWVDKLWLRLPNGKDREIYVVNHKGYWRKHSYDVFTGELLSEVDMHGNTNLIEKRKEWDPKDHTLSKETVDLRTRPKGPKAEELF